MGIKLLVVTFIQSAVVAASLPAVAASNESGLYTSDRVGTASGAHAQKQAEYAVKWTPIIAKVSGEPMLFKGSEGKYNLAYELLLTNFMTFDTTIDGIDVVDAEQPQKTLLSLRGDALKKALLVIGVKEPTAIFGEGKTGVAFINVQFEKKVDCPPKLAHKILLTSKAPENVVIPKDYITAETAVSFANPPVISSPLRGDRWVASGGYSGDLGHRKAIFPVDGEIRLAQREAIDWVKLNADNQLHVGDPAKCESYFCYGQPIYSASNGTVCGVIDKFPDQIPQTPPSGPIATYPGGNAVTVDMGNGLYAFYAHLKPGSILVKIGDVVKSGQQIATLGNSGNSSEPHLHFHISDSPVVFKADSKPYLFDKFKQVGMINDASKAFDQLDKGVAARVSAVDVGPHSLELITEGAVVDF